MNGQPDTPETLAIKQNGPETNEYIAPAPLSWRLWQVEILKKNLPSYMTWILDKVLNAVSDNDLGDLWKVCNRCCQ